MNALNRKYRNLCEFGIILNEILDLVNGSHFEGFVYVPRCANNAAHCLVGFFVLSNSSQVWK